MPKYPNKTMRQNAREELREGYNKLPEIGDVYVDDEGYKIRVEDRQDPNGHLEIVFTHEKIDRHITMGIEKFNELVNDESRSK